MKLISCFSYVHGHKEANELVTDLNSMKSENSKLFYIDYDKTQDYSKNDSFLIKGNAIEDWDSLNLSEDFMEI